MAHKIATAWTILANKGLEHVARVSFEKAAMWWRHGELEPRKFLGRPTNVARLDGCRFRLDAPVVSDDLRYLLLSGKHEAPERTLIKRWIDPSMPVVECGASVGVVACITNTRLHDPTKHVVLEANPTLIPLLSANRDLNGCQFTVLHRALAHGEAVTRFRIAENLLSSALCVATEESIAVPATTLTKVLDAHAFERSAVVCDIEGAELGLVEHEAQTLAARVTTLIMELHDRKLGSVQARRVRDLLDAAGFEIVDRVWETIALRNRHLSA